MKINIGEEVVGSAEDFNFMLLMTLKHLRTIKKEAETSVFTVAYNDKSRNVSQNWVVPGDESVKVLQKKRHNDKHDKFCNMCGGNNHDAAKCRHRSSEYANLTWDQKAIQSLSLPRVYHIPGSLTPHKRPQREKRLDRVKKETQIFLLTLSACCHQEALWQGLEEQK